MNPYQIIAQVVGERRRQIEKWGNQKHKDGTSAKFGFEAEKAKAAYSDEKRTNGDVSWRTILHEEVSEAFAEDDPVRLRHELVQVAAVAIAWIEDLDSRKKAGT